MLWIVSKWHGHSLSRSNDLPILSISDFCFLPTTIQNSDDVAGPHVEEVAMGRPNEFLCVVSLVSLLINCSDSELPLNPGASIAS